jgi:uncharacterized membrane protein YsdA (DUF1294 family)
MGWAIYYFAAVNVLAFLVYGFDKGRARANARRISERTLILIAAIGGSVGALLAMQLFRHKTRKVKFCIGVPVLLIVQIVVGLLLSYR